MSIQLMHQIRDEVCELLQKLVCIDTTNPPGNEIFAAQFLEQELSKDNFECEIIEAKPARGSLITRLEGAGNGPSLLLLSHLDVVAANSAEWSVPPFEGIVKDDFVYGRGTLDMKGMTAIEVMTLKLLKRNGIKLKGDVLLAATADEENGGFNGVSWLLKHHHEKFMADYVLNEGGGASIPTRRGNVFTVNTAEKGVMWFKLKAYGKPGHGSMPNTAVNAIEPIICAVEKLCSYKPEIVYTPTVKVFLKKIAEKNPDLKEIFEELIMRPEKSMQILDYLAGKGEPLAEEIRPRIQLTLTPTMLLGGVKTNIIPSTCEVTFDCRILPGQTVEGTLSLIRGLLSDAGLSELKLEFLQLCNGTESSIETPLYKTITDVLCEFEPNCTVTPTLLCGGTDSKFYREQGSICYGFHPMYTEPPIDGKYVRREHGIDERISIDNLVFGTSILYETVKRFMT
ncbi:MAG: M20/M25/M40 family metallo-hydrolase [Candidatus Bathyarchaeota archaeon]|nr:M20/M25/M40 family metallo-hydrolase [Candidatus Termiticorpusculum sp.]MCL1970552.1 M20/M25/M40 family metallo-hydrolase [Candidatus Termiticorpusculum sp.]